MFPRYEALPPPPPPPPPRLKREEAMRLIPKPDLLSPPRAHAPVFVIRVGVFWREKG